MEKGEPASEHFRSLADVRYPNLPKGEGLNRLEKDAQSDFSIDRSCDDKLATMAESEEFFVADARLAGMLLPHGLRVYLYCENVTRYKRIAGREEKTIVQATNETIFREEAPLFLLQSTLRGHRPCHAIRVPSEDRLEGACSR